MNSGLVCGLIALLPLLAAAPSAASSQGGAAAADQRLAVRAGLLHTAAGEPIRDGVVLIDGGRITAVGPASSVAVPAGWPLREVAVATPGLVDAHTCLGLAGFLNIDAVNDEHDPTEALQPELRAVDAYDLDDPLVAFARSFGVTTVHTGHAPLALIAGQTMVAKTYGATVDEAVLLPEAMVAAVLGDGGRGEKGPGTRAKSAALLRAALHGAAEYRAKRQRAKGEGGGEAPAEGDGERPAPPPAVDLRQEVLVRVIEGTTPLLVTAHDDRDLLTALRLGAEFPQLRLVLDGAAEAPQVLDELRAAGVPVIVHPTMQRPGGEARHLSMATARLLAEAGIPTALQSGYEGYVPRTRVLLFEAAIAVRAGLAPGAALRAITLDAARLIGVADRVGSLEVGKDGDLALFDGDPFEYTSHCVGTVIEGRVVSDGEQWVATGDSGR
jgi:imidazolonepropionase-like amidohydrolase